MITPIRFYLKVLQLLAARKVVSASTIARGYDRISAGYDTNFTSHVAPHSLRMVSALGLGEGARVMDLASGTGTLTIALAKQVGPRGKVISVDRSKGMLDIAAAKACSAALTNIRLVESDMLDAIRDVPDASLDAVTCGWALGYVHAVSLLRAAASKLKPGGVLGIIENTRDTLGPIRRSAVKVASRHPHHLQQIMDLHFHLPAGTRQLRNWFRQAGLSVRDVWKGGVERQFAGGEDALGWVLKTGAGVGFNAMMAEEVKTACDAEFAALIERDHMRDGIITVTHRYVVGIGEKETEREAVPLPGAARLPAPRISGTSQALDSRLEAGATRESLKWLRRPAGMPR